MAVVVVGGPNCNKANLSQPAKLELGLGVSLAKDGYRSFSVWLNEFSTCIFLQNSNNRIFFCDQTIKTNIFAFAKIYRTNIQIYLME